jgi:dynein light intermediate chain 1
VVPPNWDSWGKIRVLGGAFDAEQTSNGWSEDIKLPLDSELHTLESLQQAKSEAAESGAYVQQESAIARYEEWCRDSNNNGISVVDNAMNNGSGNGSAVGMESEDTQEFLERQLKILEAFKSKAPEKPSESAATPGARRSEFADENAVNEHIGPVQFNMGGIQVDADDMLQRLKVIHSLKRLRVSLAYNSLQDRNANNATPEDTPPQTESPAPGAMTKEFDNEQLQNFFSGLMNRSGGGPESPR